MEGFYDWNGEGLDVLTVSGAQNGIYTLSLSNFPAGFHVAAMRILRITTHLQSTGLRDWMGCTARRVHTSDSNDS